MKKQVLWMAIAMMPLVLLEDRVPALDYREKEMNVLES